MFGRESDASTYGKLAPGFPRLAKGFVRRFRLLLLRYHADEDGRDGFRSKRLRGEPQCAQRSCKEPACECRHGGRGDQNRFLAPRLLPHFRTRLSLWPISKAGKPLHEFSCDRIHVEAIHGCADHHSIGLEVSRQNVRHSECWQDTPTLWAGSSVRKQSRSWETGRVPSRMYHGAYLITTRCGQVMFNGRLECLFVCLCHLFGPKINRARSCRSIS